MRSLRARLLIGTGATTAVIVGIAAASLYFLVRSALYAEFDALLAAKARALAALVEQDQDQIEIEFIERPLEEFERAERPEYFQLWLDDGTVLARSTRLKQQNLPAISRQVGDQPVHTVQLPDGRSGRLAAVTFVPAFSGDETRWPRRHVTLVVARETAAVDATLAKLTWILSGVASATALLIVFALAWVIHRNLVPIARLSHEIDSIDADQLAARFDVGHVPDELQPLVQRLNHLLARLDKAFEREKSFTADAAHELRTPLAGLLTTLEVSLARQRNSDEYRQALQRCLVICQRMKSMIETLLKLARLHKPEPPGSTQLVHVATALSDGWNAVDARARERNLDIHWRVDDTLRLQVDAGSLRMMLENLLGNAVAHANEAGRVLIESAVHDRQVTIRIINSGSQVRSDETERVFEAFWRGDKARTGTGSHAGLGLALCKRLASFLGCRITVTSVQGGDFSVALDFPWSHLDQASSQPPSAAAGTPFCPDTPAIQARSASE